MKGIAARLLSHVAFLGIVGIVGVALKEDVIACPSQLAVVNQSIYSYPIDIYQTMRVVPKDEKVDTCFAADLKFPSYHNCSYAPFCPIQESNIRDALEVMTWTPYVEAFCRLQSKTAKKPRVFVIGASVAAGSYSSGCCCIEELSGVCPVNKRCSNSTPLKIPYLAVECAWHNYLRDMMLNSTGLIDVEVIVYPLPGRHSILMSNYILTLLSKKEIQLTGDDIILLDFSVNDGLFMKKGSIIGKRWELHLGVERFLRNILSHSNASSSSPRSSSFPTIVLLDSCPRFIQYSQIYIDIARHYSVLLWSYRHAALSETTERTQAAYSGFLNFSNNNVGPTGEPDHHPPW